MLVNFSLVVLFNAHAPVFLSCEFGPLPFSLRLSIPLSIQDKGIVLIWAAPEEKLNSETKPPGHTLSENTGSGFMDYLAFTMWFIK